MADDNSWMTAASRQTVVNTLIKERLKSTLTLSQTESEMENSIFLKARNKVEYFFQVVNLIVKIRKGGMEGDRQITYYSSFIPGTDPPLFEDNSWETPEFRQAMVKKIDDAIEKLGIPSKSIEIGKEAEGRIFLRAHNKDAYLGYLDCYISNIVENFKSAKKAKCRPTPYQRPAAKNAGSNKCPPEPRTPEDGS